MMVCDIAQHFSSMFILLRAVQIHAVLVTRTRAESRAMLRAETGESAHAKSDLNKREGISTVKARIRLEFDKHAGDP